uniref:Radial spoke head protein 9 homolog n=1 Tax=Oncorhynchus kisutch TaxID=8019 RepID=A0A8C7ILG0_ONCKI
MESKTLFYSLDLVSGNGLTLSSEQKAALQTSLVILRNYLQILGIQGDYFIAQGVSDDEMSHNNSLFFLRCKGYTEVSSAAKGRYVGDTSHKYELPTTVHTIDKQVSVVLRGTSIKSPHGLVQRVALLSSSEMDKLRCFLHFTEPKNLKKKSILDLDIPKGNRVGLSTAVLCVISSMLWLGLTTYEEPLTP